jgi:hypothetical protein
MWTGTDLTTLLVVALAMVAVILMLRKRYDSNIPLLFYLAAVVFLNATDREINPYLLYVGLVSALLLRFEFMGRGFAKFIAFLATSSMCLIIWMFLAQVFGEDLAPF